MTDPKTRTIETDDNHNPKVDEIEVRGLTFPVYVSEGTFITYVSDETDRRPDRLGAKSIEELRAKLVRHTASTSARIEVPFWHFADGIDDTWGASRGKRVAPPSMSGFTIRGVHASTGNVLIRRDGTKKTEQADYAFSKHYCFRGDMPEADRAAYVQTFIEEEAIRARRAALYQKWGIDLIQEAKDAVKQVVG